MAIRITGISSGLDTDSMVQELVKASSSKVDDLKKAQTKLEWTQTAWSDLNAKVYAFYNKTVTNMSLEGAYKKKKTTIADSNIASIVNSDSAVNGTQTLAVKSLAKSGYLTGGKLDWNGQTATGASTLNTLSGTALGARDEITLNVKNAGKESTITLNGNSSINDFIKQLKDAGITANFDSANQRIFISANDSGAANDFSITANDMNGLKALSSLGLLTAEDVDSNAAYTEYGSLYGNDAEITAKAEEVAAGKAAGQLASLKEAESQLDKLSDIAMYLATKDTADPDDEAFIALKGRLEDYGWDLEDPDVENSMKDTLSGSAADLKAYQESINGIKALRDYYTTKGISGYDLDAVDAISSKLTALVTDINDSVGANTVDLSSVPTPDLLTDAKSEVEAKAEAAHNARGELLNGASATAVRILGQDASILLNGAEYTSATNSFSINGLTLTANSVSDIVKDANGNDTYVTTTLNTSLDVDAIYDSIKGFFKEYNDLIKEMDTLYNADSAKGYEPLTDEEKDEMSDDEVEKWEKKIKDALFRRDSNLGGVITSMKTAMLGNFSINGTKYNLASFGIETLGYFESEKNERGVYHIAGDADDSNSADKEDKLKAMIANDPDTVMSFFSQLVKDMKSTLEDKMKSIEDYRSKYKIYDDKKMKSDYDDYSSKIKKQEKKLQDLEDRYYKQFSAMEKAMTELNSKQSSLSSLFGS